jgi:hypothetical protein
LESLTLWGWSRTKDRWRGTILHVAVRNLGSHTRREASELLPKHGESPNIIEKKKGFTCLNNAVDDVELIRRLIKHGAGCQSGNQAGDFPCHRRPTYRLSCTTSGIWSWSKFSDDIISSMGTRGFQIMINIHYFPPHLSCLTTQSIETEQLSPPAFYWIRGPIHSWFSIMPGNILLSSIFF